MLYSESLEDLNELTPDQLDIVFKSTKVIQMYYEPGLTLMELVMAAKIFDREGKGEILHTKQSKDKIKKNQCENTPFS